ncbi:hypothetical protein BaRGS_00034208 [Batillaria attramentaria]|uniref:Uncharacterized protein n=1 Tax=Batillaria attramentaria TaxID=370345 RepID=A0ABD0JHW9_9CAEN
MVEVQEVKKKPKKPDDDDNNKNTFERVPVARTVPAETGIIFQGREFDGSFATENCPRTRTRVLQETRELQDTRKEHDGRIANPVTGQELGEGEGEGLKFTSSAHFPPPRFGKRRSSSFLTK